MTSSNKPAYRIVAAVALVVAVSGATAAVLGGSSDNKPRRAASASASTTVATTLQPSTTAPTRATTPTSQRPESGADDEDGEAPADVADGGRLHAPAPGVYTYRSESSGDQFSYSVTSVSDAEDAAVRDVRFGDRGPTERHVWTSSEHNVAGFSTAGNERVPPQSCEYEPDVVVIRLPLAVGETWETTSQCTTGSGSSTTTVDRVDVVKVVGTGVEVVAGQDVPVWLLEIDSRSTFTASFNSGTGVDDGSTGSTYRRESVLSYSLAHGLAVREKFKVTSDAPVGAQSFSDELILLDLRPQASDG